LDDDLKRGD